MGEVRAGPGPADVERKQVGEENANSRKFKANITSHKIVPQRQTQVLTPPRGMVHVQE